MPAGEPYVSAAPEYPVGGSEVGEHGFAGGVLHAVVVGDDVEVAVAGDGESFDLLRDPAVGFVQVGQQIVGEPFLQQR